MGNRKKVVLFALCIYGLLGFINAIPTSTFVVSSTEPSKEASSEVKKEDEKISLPQITEMDVSTNVSNRFAKTLITSKVKNAAMKAQEATFTVILPESAYISKFIMEIGGKSYEAYVKEKEEAKQIYDQAVSHGLSAGHVSVNARDSNRFTVSVNVEPESKAIFYLTYEELLQRKNNQYEVVINVQPGQIVKHLDLQVHINETRPLKFVRTPALRSGNEIVKNNPDLVPQTNIKTINETSAVVTFSPDIDQQRDFAEKFGKEKDNGLSGQFIVQYDVDRDTKGGEILINDGYFVHFFSPSDLPPLKKQVVFVLDMSGSMSFSKMDKVKEAMDEILTDLKPEDVFSIVAFDDDIRIFDIENNNITLYNVYGQDPLKTQFKQKEYPTSVSASEDHKKIAKGLLRQIDALGGTNIMGGLETGIFLVQNFKISEENFSPMIIFLTDGEANVGISLPDEIIAEVQKLTSDKKIPIYSLSFGDGADRSFLEKLSLKNLAFARHIYDAADANLQLQDFYKQISSPLLSNVKFQYVDDQVKEVTKTYFPLYFDGGELIVAGKCIGEEMIDSDIAQKVTGSGENIFFSESPVKETPIGNLERLWAYLTIKQKLEDSKLVDNKTVLEREALEVALKYSFVTPVSSLVVVKPNDTSSINTEDASKSQSGYQHSYQQSFSGPGNTFASAGSSPRRGRARSRTKSRIIAGVPILAAEYDSFGGYGQSVSYPQIHSTTSQILPAVHSIEKSESSTATTGMISLEELKSKLPWLESVLGRNQTLIVKGDIYNLGLDQFDVQHQNCTNAPLDAAGECTLLHECPSMYNLLNDFQDYEKYFCALDTFGGVCCPK